MVIPGCCVWAVVFPCVHTFHAFSDPTVCACDRARLKRRSSSRTARAGERGTITLSIVGVTRTDVRRFKRTRTLIRITASATHTTPPTRRPGWVPCHTFPYRRYGHGPRLPGGSTTLRATEKAASMAHERPTLAACFGVGMRAA